MQLFEISYAYKFIGGFYLAMAALHGILYFYNRNKISNLIYASGMLLVFVNFTFAQRTDSWTGAVKLNILTDLAANGALLFYVTNHVIKVSLPGLRKTIRTFGWIYTGGCVLVLINSQMLIFSTPLEVILRGAIYVVIGTSCVIGLIKKIPNFYLIVIATLLLMIVWVFAGSDIFNIWQGDYPFYRVLFILVGFISPGLAYSYYLSKYLSITKKNLKREYTINEQLSLIKLQAEKIHELDQQKSRFFANISHEFRTPLTLILSPVEKRLREVTDVQEIAGLRLIQRNAGHLLHLVNQLLDLSKLESGHMKLRTTVLPLNDYLKKLLFSFQSLAEARDIQFTFNPSGAIEVHADPEKLEKIINNLLSNAFKFTPAGGKVSLSVEVFPSTSWFKTGLAEIRIEDNGIGIAEADLDKIFDRFYQADGSQTREHEGTGIGLALTKELVELHRGAISVHSTPQVGSIFTVQLPLGNGHLDADEIGAETDQPVERLELSDIYASTENSEQHSIEERDRALPRILIVEDNPDLRNYLRENLAQHFNTLEAGDGLEGIQSAIGEMPDLIISDLMMPKTNGLQLCERLKDDERTCHIPIVLLTARADIESKLEGYRHGADDYIPKPFQFDELLVRLKNLLANRKRVQEKFARHLAFGPSEVPVTSMDERFFKRAMEVVEKAMEDTGFGVEPFAREMAVSQTQLYRKLQAISGYSPSEFIRHIRLERAADLLRKKAGNVSDVAYMVGITNLSYFAKVFKEKFGVTPNEFLKS